MRKKRNSQKRPRRTAHSRDYTTTKEKEAMDIFFIQKGFVRTFNFPLDSLEVPNAAEFYSIWTKNFTAPKLID